MLFGAPFRNFAADCKLQFGKKCNNFNPGRLIRLKTYLRSTCGQQRLNSIAICNVHKDVMDTINVNELMRDFVLAKDNRAAVFGHVEV